MILRRLVWAIILLAISRPAIAMLSADQLLLVANQNLPESVELAKYYARVRQVPAEQILALDLPKGEDILPDQYEKRLASKVREYLATETGKKIKCIVLFYGVPLHVTSRENTPEQRQELQRLRIILADLDRRLITLANLADDQVRRVGMTPKKIEGVTGAASAVRFESARVQVAQWYRTTADDTLKKSINDAMFKAVSDVSKYAIEVMNPQTGNASSQPTTNIAVDDLPKTLAEFEELEKNHRDPFARDKVRRVVAIKSGAFALWQTIQQQIEWLDETESDAAVDSELMLVKETDFPHFLYRLSTYSLEYADSTPNQVMVGRIDGPDLQVARRIIDDAIATEKTGLTGRFVIDGRGIPNDKIGTYGWYDELLRNTATVVSTKTNIPVLLDAKPEVLPANSASDVGLYIGWYNLQKYVPACTFNRGAVGFHVASLEMTDFRNPQTREWAANLLRDGVCVTLGAVSEPYLHSFPRPNEFFPMLMTGEWSLIEVYSMTSAFVSWKIVLIGDPLCRPFAAHPALKRQDLPPVTLTAILKIEEKYGIGR